MICCQYLLFDLLDLRPRRPRKTKAQHASDGASENSNIRGTSLLFFFACTRISGGSCVWVVVINKLFQSITHETIQPAVTPPSPPQAPYDAFGSQLLSVKFRTVCLLQLKDLPEYIDSAKEHCATKIQPRSEICPRTPMGYFRGLSRISLLRTG